MCHMPCLAIILRVSLANSVFMKLSLRTLALLLPLVASSLGPKKRKRDEDDTQNTKDDNQSNSLSSRNELEKHLAFNLDVPLPPVASSVQQMIENNNNSNILQDDPVNVIPPQLTWNKRELASLVKELRQMEEEEAPVHDIFDLYKIIVKKEYRSSDEDINFSVLYQRIICIVTEAEMHGLKIGGAVKRIVYSFFDNMSFVSRFAPILIKSENTEVLAAVFSHSDKIPNMENHFTLIKNDKKLQRRILELLNVGIQSGKDMLHFLSKCYGKCLRLNFSEDKQEYAFPLYVKYSLYHRKMSPEDIILELSLSTSFEELLSKLASKYVPTKTSAQLDGEVAMMLIHAGLANVGKKVITKSKFRKLADGERIMFKVVRKYGKNNKMGRLLFLQNAINKGILIDLAISNTKIMGDILRLGNVKDALGTISIIYRFLDQRSQICLLEIGEIAARLVLEASIKPIKFRGTCHSIQSLINLCSKIFRALHFSFIVKHPAINYLDRAFHGGNLLDVLQRHGHFLFDNYHLRELIAMDSCSRGLYTREIALRLALFQLLGNKESSDYLEWKCFVSSEIIRKIPKDLFGVGLWKYAFIHAISTMKYLNDEMTGEDFKKMFKDK